MKTKQAFKKIWIVALLVTTIGTLWAQQQTSKEKFSLPPLPYEMNALTPVISEATIKLHHGKHLKTYIDNLNKLIVGTPFENCDLETIVKNSTGAIFNNAAQALNHIIYFNSFSPKAEHTPSGALLSAIEKEWGSFDNFKKNSQQLPPRYSGLDGYGSQKIKKGNYTFCPKITPGTLSRKVTPQYWESMFGNTPTTLITRIAVRNTLKNYGQL